MLITNCRSCGCDDLRIILDLGSQPIANALLERGGTQPSGGEISVGRSILPGMCAIASDRDGPAGCPLSS